MILTVSASEIIQELPKLSDAERQAVLDKLRELAQVDDDRWELQREGSKAKPYQVKQVRKILAKYKLL